MVRAVSITLICLVAGCQRVDTPQSRDGTNFARKPIGRLTDNLGELITIEGIQTEEDRRSKSGPLLSVDTVNGVNLKKPRSIEISGFEIPPDVRCVLRGYETGCMIGQPNAEIQAAEELGQEPEYLPLAYQWSTRFVVLIVVEPPQT